MIHLVILLNKYTHLINIGGIHLFMEETFKQASIWSIVWRVILTSLVVELISGIFLFIFPFQYSEIISLTGSLTLYYLIYKITLSQIDKQNISSLAITGRGHPDKKKLIPIGILTLLIAGTGYFFIFFILRIIISFISPDEFITPFMNMNFEGLDPTGPSLLYYFPVAVIAAPIVEEIFFRGFVLNKWSEKYGNVKGVLFSSLLFMGIHIGSLLLPQLLMGILCAVIYIKTKKIIYPILVHSFYNFFIILPTLIPNKAILERGYTELFLPKQDIINDINIYATLFVMFFLVAVISLLFYSKKLNQEQTPYLYNFEKYISKVPHETIPDERKFPEF